MLATAVSNLDDSSIWISRSIGLLRNGGGDAHIMPWFSLHEFTTISDHPGFDVRRKPVRVGEQKIRREFFLPVVRKFRRADQRRNDCREGRRRVAGILLPTFLRSHRSVEN